MPSLGSVRSTIFSLYLISSLLAGTVAGAVVGGRPVSGGDLIRRSIVEISGPGCTGVVISDRKVLTAAHCTAELSPLLVILKAALYQECSHARVEDVFYPPDEKSISINGQDWPSPDLAVLRLRTPLCGARPAALSSEPLTPGRIVRTAGYSQGLWNGREADWTRVRILRSNTKLLMSLFSNHKSNAGRLRQMIQAEVPLFNFARPVKDDEAICQGDSGGPVYTETGGSVSIYGVTSGILSDPKIGNSKCDGSLIQLVVPIQPERNWILSTFADPAEQPVQ
jgi:secreted trypsin-like serine protease